MDKRTGSLAEAVAGVQDGAAVMIGGFGGAGEPIELIHALIDRYLATGAPNGLTVINNNAGNGRDRHRRDDRRRHGPEGRLLLPAQRRIRALSPRNISPGGSSSKWCRRARSPNASAPAAPAFRPSIRRPRSGPISRRASRRRIRRPLIRPGAVAEGRHRADQGRSRRCARQPRLPDDGAKLLAGDGDGGERARSRR